VIIKNEWLRICKQQVVDYLKALYHYAILKIKEIQDNREVGTTGNRSTFSEYLPAVTLVFRKERNKQTKEKERPTERKE
jgi:hypothetical protein